MNAMLDTQTAMQTAEAPKTILDVLETQFRILPCDWCRSRKNQLVYTDPASKIRYCLACLESMFEDKLPAFDDTLPDVTEDMMIDLLDRMTDSQLL